MVTFPLAACSSGSGSPARTSLAPTTTVHAPPTTAAPPGLIPQDSPGTAATTLFRAWSTGNRRLAGQVATPAVVDALFGRPATDVSNRGCQDPVGGQASCAFRAGDGLVQVHTVTLAGGWVVDSIVFE